MVWLLNELTRWWGDKLICLKVYELTSWLIDESINVDELANWLDEMWISWQVDELTSWLIHESISWSVDQLISWLVDKLFSKWVDELSFLLDDVLTNW